MEFPWGLNQQNSCVYFEL